MEPITEKTPGLMVSHLSIFLYTAEASDLRFPVGEWPRELPTTLGNGQPFIRTSKKQDAEGDIMWVTYHQLLGCISLRIFND